MIKTFWNRWEINRGNYMLLKIEPRKNSSLSPVIKPMLSTVTIIITNDKLRLMWILASLRYILQFFRAAPNYQMSWSYNVHHEFGYYMRERSRCNFFFSFSNLVEIAIPVELYNLAATGTSSIEWWFDIRVDRNIMC